MTLIIKASPLWRTPSDEQMTALDKGIKGLPSGNHFIQRVLKKLLEAGDNGILQKDLVSNGAPYQYGVMDIVRKLIDLGIVNRVGNRGSYKLVITPEGRYYYTRVAEPAYRKANEAVDTLLDLLPTCTYTPTNISAILPYRERGDNSPVLALYLESTIIIKSDRVDATYKGVVMVSIDDDTNQLEIILNLGYHRNGPPDILFRGTLDGVSITKAVNRSHQRRSVRETISTIVEAALTRDPQFYGIASGIGDIIQKGGSIRDMSSYLASVGIPLTRS